MKTLFEYISRTFENATPANTMGMGEVIIGSQNIEGSEPMPIKKKKTSKKKRNKNCKEEE